MREKIWKKKCKQKNILKKKKKKKEEDCGWLENRRQERCHEIRVGNYTHSGSTIMTLTPSGAKKKL